MMKSAAVAKFTVWPVAAPLFLYEFIISVRYSPFKIQILLVPFPAVFLELYRIGVLLQLPRAFLQQPGAFSSLL